jgi:hypothetical protein
VDRVRVAGQLIGEFGPPSGVRAILSIMPPPKDDERKALRRHPGYEPTDPPPAEPSEKRTPSERARAVTVGTRPVHPQPREDRKSEPTPEAEAKPEAAVEAKAEPPGDEHVGLARIETLLANGDWRRVAELLGKEDAKHLPPRDALLYALARHEGDALADANAMTRLAIESVASLLDVPATSEIALVVAKRLLRKTPVSWARRPAPPARVSILIILVVLVLSGALGWVLSSTHVKWHVW